MHNPLSLLILFLLLLTSTTIPPTHSHSHPPPSSSPDTFIYGGCTQQKYSPDSPYAANLQALKTSLLTSSTYSSYSNLTVLGSSSSAAIYALYQCRGDLPMPACSSCLSHALSRLSSLCPSTSGAAIQLDGCFVKYDSVSFVGVVDKTVVFKKCGPTSGGGGVGSVDAVLYGMSGSGGYFRVVGSGNVAGVGQCTGDLRLDQCEDCLSEAIKRLKSECGSGDYGDVFLGKCYARFSVGGAHAFYEQPKANNVAGKSKNGGEKTFVIIIGLLAGLAVLVIFLAFLKSICTRSHGK